MKKDQGSELGHMPEMTGLAAKPCPGSLQAQSFQSKVPFSLPPALQKVFSGRSEF